MTMDDDKGCCGDCYFWAANNEEIREPFLGKDYTPCMLVWNVLANDLSDSAGTSVSNIPFYHRDAKCKLPGPLFKSKQ